MLTWSTCLGFSVARSVPTDSHPLVTTDAMLWTCLDICVPPLPIHVLKPQPLMWWCQEVVHLGVPRSRWCLWGWGPKIGFVSLQRGRNQSTWAACPILCSLSLSLLVCGIFLSHPVRMKTWGNWGWQGWKLFPLVSQSVNYSEDLNEGQSSSGAHSW
jgi:hypothetical protein